MDSELFQQPLRTISGVILSSGGASVISIAIHVMIQHRVLDIHSLG